MFANTNQANSNLCLQQLCPVGGAAVVNLLDGRLTESVWVSVYDLKGTQDDTYGRCQTQFARENTTGSQFSWSSGKVFVCNLLCNCKKLLNFLEQ